MMLDLHPEISANGLNNIECMYLTLSTETDRWKAVPLKSRVQQVNCH